jgi:hypothetical protein
VYVVVPPPTESFFDTERDVSEYWYISVRATIWNAPFAVMPVPASVTASVVLLTLQAMCTKLPLRAGLNRHLLTAWPADVSCTWACASSYAFSEHTLLDSFHQISPMPPSIKMKPSITPNSELQSLPAKDWCVTSYGISDLDEAEIGQSTAPRMVGEAEGVAVVNRR